jgi:hypothetical protein
MTTYRRALAVATASAAAAAGLALAAPLRRPLSRRREPSTS